MSSFDDLREGLGQAWDDLAEGWRELWQRAGQALTRFRPAKPQEDAESGELQLNRSMPRWGLIPAEVYDEDNQVVVRVEAPGLERADFKVEIHDDVLWISGEKHLEREERRGEYFLTERAYGRFERAVPLPAGADNRGASASYRRGVLSVTLKKSSPAQVRRIPVQSG